jgi:hypothetical protein
MRNGHGEANAELFEVTVSDNPGFSGRSPLVVTKLEEASQ